MHRERSEAERQVAGLLRTARRKLDLSVAFLSRIDASTRTMQVVDSALPQIADGYAGAKDGGSASPSSRGGSPR